MKHKFLSLRHYLYNTKLVHKFFYLLVLLLIVEVIVSNFYIKNNAAQLLTQEVHSTSKQFLEQYIDNINYKLVKFNTLLNSFSSNEQIKQTFSNPDPTGYDYEMTHKEIRQLLNNQFPYGLYDLTFYPLKSSLPDKSSFIKSLANDTGNWRAEYENQYYNHYFMHTEGSFDTELLSILKPIYSTDGEEIVCIIKLSLSPEKVFKAVKKASGELNYPVFFIDTDGNYIYGESFAGMDNYIDYLKNNYGKIYNGTPVAEYTDSANEAVYLTSTNAASGIRAVYYFSYSEPLGQIKILNRTLTLGILFLVFITFAAGILLSLSVNRRFKIVLDKIKTVSDGNLKVEESHLGLDEIGIFDTSFTQMVHKVDQLITENYISEMKKKDAEFMALQAQINPHFLFNSLEIINSLIEVEQYDTACEVNSRLSELLRYCINHNSSGIVTVEEEINYMNNYIYIQNLRFRNKFHFHTDVEAPCLKCRIIKLVFQPLIENSIKHGFSGISCGGNIWFSVHMHTGCLKISVSDDGSGMDEADYIQLMDTLNQEDIEDFREQNESIGILNIHHRLRLTFGDNYRISITTAPRKGMHTELTIPIL